MELAQDALQNKTVEGLAGVDLGGHRASGFVDGTARTQLRHGVDEAGAGRVTGVVDDGGASGDATADPGDLPVDDDDRSGDRLTAVAAVDLVDLQRDGVRRRRGTF